MQTIHTDERFGSLKKQTERANLNSVALRQRNPIRWLVSCGIALIVAIVAGTAIMVGTFRESTITASTKELQNAVELLAAHFDQELSDFSVVQNVLAQKAKDITAPGDFRRLVATSEMHIWLRTKLEGATNLTGVNVYDESGTLINTSDSFPVPAVDISDRKYFRVLKSAPSISINVELLRSRVTGNVVLLIARKMTGADGTFLGVATRGFSPKRFDEFFSTVAQEKDAAISVLHRDGTVLASYPLVEGAFDKTLTSERSPAELSSTDRGFARLTSPTDGRKRIVTTRALTHFPLTISGTTTIAQALSDWRKQTNSIVTAAGLLMTAVAATLFLIGTSLMRQSRASRDQLAAENDLLDTAINNMPHGLLLYDPCGRLIVSNNRYVEMFGLASDVVQPGRSFRELLDHHKERGSFSGDVQEYYNRIQGVLKQKTPHAHVYQLDDRRWIRVAYQPLDDGGWVTTLEDVTERTRAEQALIKNETLLTSTLAGLSEGVVVQDETGRIISCNPSAERILRAQTEDLLNSDLRQVLRGAIREDNEIFLENDFPSDLALSTGKPQHQIIMGLRHPDETFTWVSINAVPIFEEGATKAESVVTSISDITSRKLAQEMLSEAIAAIPDGFVIYDNNDRLTTYNDAYEDLYAASAPAMKPGISFAELLQYGIDNGQYPEAGETREQQSEWLAERMMRHRASNSNVVQQLPNGRWLQIRERRTPSGYIVGVRTDVTELKRETAKLQAVIDNFPGGISFLDPEFNLAAWNSTFLKLLDLPSELFENGSPSLEAVIRSNALRGEYGPGDAEDQVRARLELARKAEAHLFERTRPDGTVLEVRGTPIKGGGFITTYTDVTERHTAAKRLAESERTAQENSATLEHTLANMGQGLSMFDADGRLMVWNKRYANIYGFPADFLVRGRSVTDIAEHMKRTGYLQTDEPDWQFRLAEKRSFASTLKYDDGRVIRIFRTPIEGSGWVATHEDVTEQIQAEMELVRQSAEFARLNMHFNAALSNMTHGLVMFDDQRRLVVWNERFAEIYKIPSPLLKVGTRYEDIVADRIVREGEQNEANVAARVAELVELNSDARRIEELADGRSMLISRQPMDTGGWVSIIEDITNRRRAEAEILHLARHDSLTGLANRSEFNARLDEVSKRIKRYGGAFTVMMLDLDKFKIVNDTLGHPAGDALLVEVARRLISSVRETDLVARLGGDEFAIIQDGNPNQKEGATTLALRIIAAIGESFDLNGHQANVGTSIGIALAPSHGVEPEELLKKADLALYDAKEAGRNDFRIFEQDMLDLASSQQTAENQLRNAIEREEFELHYQPLFDAKTREITSVEALVRWRHPTEGLIGPDRFVPLAESTGLVVSLGNWVLQRACADAASWPKHIKVAVNISPLQFKSGNLFDVILCTLVETGLHAERLELEITETAILENQEAYLSSIRQLKNLGISIALDDFGTGYSSVNYLTVFPFDKIKIDKSYTEGVLQRRDCKAVVASTLALAKGLGMLTTAEGVETEDQLVYMREAGIDLIQGYLLGRPVPSAQLQFQNEAEGIMVA